MTDHLPAADDGRVHPSSRAASDAGLSKKDHMGAEAEMLSPGEWRPFVNGLACRFGDNAPVQLANVTELGEAIVVCEDGHEWLLTAPVVRDRLEGRSGICEELGIYDALLAAVGPAGGTFCEYGTIEHRLAAANPALYAELVHRYGHTQLEKRRYTVSSLLGGALERLSTEGAVVHADGPATGRWNYLHRVSHWATPPADNTKQQLSWAQYATDQNIDPRDWPSTDGLTGPD